MHALPPGAFRYDSGKGGPSGLPPGDRDMYKRMVTFQRFRTMETREIRKRYQNKTEDYTERENGLLENFLCTWF